MCRTISRWNRCGHPKTIPKWEVQCILKWEGGKCKGHSFERDEDDKTLCYVCWTSIEQKRGLHLEKQASDTATPDIPFRHPFPEYGRATIALPGVLQCSHNQVESGQSGG
nr:hypothetical protein CFP56_41279 [Quercus suber]